MNISEAQMLSIERLLARRRRSFEYPWVQAIESDRRATGEASLPMIGYGSLVNRSSACQTLGTKSMGRIRPVVAFGVRRLFNYAITEDQTRYGPVPPGPERAALNVRATGSPADRVNGVLILVEWGDIDALAAREQGYNLIEVPYVAWSDPEGVTRMAFILSAPDAPRDGLRHTRDDVLPFAPYFRASREGASEWGGDFLEYWLDHTFLADDVTPVRHWTPEED